MSSRGTIWTRAMWIASLAALVALVVGGPVLEFVFVVIAGAFPILLIGLGASRRGRLSRGLVVVLSVLGVELVGCLVWLFALRGRVAPGDWPVAGNVLLLGLWLSPLLVVGFGYAFTFDRETLREEDLRRLRQSRS